MALDQKRAMSSSNTARINRVLRIAMEPLRVLGRFRFYAIFVGFAGELR